MLGFGLTFGSRAIGVSYPEQVAVVFLPKCGTKQGQRVLAGREILSQIEAAGAAQPTAAESRDEGAFVWLQLRTDFRQVRFNRLEIEGRQSQVHAAGANRGQQRRRV